MAVPAVAVIGNGRLAQLVRALPSHGRGQRFKSFVAHHSFPFSHIGLGQTSQVRFFVLNLLFRSGSTHGLMPLDGYRSEGHAVAGMRAVLYSAAMANLSRTLEFLGLSLWLGSDVFLSFVVAPGAFRILGSRDSAGAIVGYGLWWMHLIGVVCGIVVLLARLMRTRTFASLATPPALCVVLMILLTVVSQHAVSPKMAALRVQMGSIQATAADSPLLAEFGRLHRISISLEGGVLLVGFAAMYLMVKDLAVTR
jgi:uncharacterized membrane protein